MVGGMRRSRRQFRGDLLEQSRRWDDLLAQEHDLVFLVREAPVKRLLLGEGKGRSRGEEGEGDDEPTARCAVVMLAVRHGVRDARAGGVGIQLTETEQFGRPATLPLSSQTVILSHTPQRGLKEEGEIACPVGGAKRPVPPQELTVHSPTLSSHARAIAKVREGRLQIRQSTVLRWSRADACTIVQQEVETVMARGSGTRMCGYQSRMRLQQRVGKRAVATCCSRSGGMTSFSMA